MFGAVLTRILGFSTRFLSSESGIIEDEVKIMNESFGGKFREAHLAFDWLLLVVAVNWDQPIKCMLPFIRTWSCKCR